ncbi:hypothetical protein P9112_003463 [Eukaryota sp. TZLM1-RC]
MSLKLQIGLVLTFLIVITTNVMVYIFGINNTTDVFDQYGIPFLPATITFAFWAVVYALALVYIVLQFYVSAIDGFLARMFYLISFLNISWLLLVILELIASFIASLLYLAVLLRVYVYLQEKPIITGTDVLTYVAFTTHASWVFLVSVFNGMMMLSSVGVDLTSLILTRILIVVMPLLFIAVLKFLSKRFDRSPYIVLSWALVGIGIRNSEDVVTLSFALVMALVAGLMCVEKVGESIGKGLRKSERIISEI